METKEEIINFETFIQKFEPIQNNLDAPIDGFMFETYGSELEKIKTYTNEHIWTLIDGENKLYLISGYHYVNRLGYLVTKNKWTSETIVDVDEG